MSHRRNASCAALLIALQGCSTEELVTLDTDAATGAELAALPDAEESDTALDAGSALDVPPTPDVGSPDDAPLDPPAPLDARPSADVTDATVATDRGAAIDAPPTRPAGLPSWVIFTPTGGGVVVPAIPPLGTPQPHTVRNESIRATIVLRTPGVYDFANVMHVWAGSGRCIQLENQPPILHIASSNVTVRNFGYRNAPDGIHIGAAVGMGQGYNNQARVENVVLDHVYGYACEDALTTQYNTWRVTIENSWFHGNPNTAERDKLLQLNFGNDLRILATTFVNSPRCVRFKGGARITIEQSLFDGCDDAVRGDTLDVLGLIPTTHSDVYSQRNTYRAYNRTFSAIGNVTIYSQGDTLTLGRRQAEESGGQVVYR